jgi:hypothetical protein
MKQSTFNLPLVLLGLCLVALLWPMAVTAQEAAADRNPNSNPNTPAIPLNHPAAPTADGLIQTPDGLWISTGAGDLQAQSNVPQATGGPDDFGYTWDKTIPLSWIDASGGIDTGITPNNNRTGPIDIGFPFKYYENTYSSLYISLYGFVTFRDTGRWWNDQSRIPSPNEPNDVIAPSWIPIERVDGYIRYAHGGTAPNRWFVVEWNRVISDCCSGGVDPTQLTFQLILHENGIIDMQYLDMSYGRSNWCMASGIEDSTGLDGLTITEFCYRVDPNHAVRITRPPVSARVQVYPRYQGRFTQAGAVQRFEIPVRNTGELGVDTYDVTVSSPWPARLLKSDGGTALTDTNNSGIPDTGSVTQGGATRIFVEVQTPFAVDVGNNNQTIVTLRSSLNSSKTQTAHLSTAVPAPFAQVYYDWADSAMAFHNVLPNRQMTQKVTEDYYFGSDVAVTETPNGFIYLWSKGYENSGGVWTRDLEYTLLGKTGQITRPVNRLTDSGTATVNTYHYNPAIAAMADGRTGVLWNQYLYNPTTGQFLYNIHFAILDPLGNVVHGPENLTQNATWSTWGDSGVPRFFSPRIVATKDSRFVMVWVQEIQHSDRYSQDLFSAVRNGHGASVTDPTPLTDAIGENAYFSSPALVALDNGLVFLAYSNNGRIEYRTLNSTGNAATAVQAGSSDTALYGYGLDAVQLSGGRIALTWIGWRTENRPVNTIALAILDQTGSNIVAGPVDLTVPRLRIDSGGVSVTRDESDNAIVTWMDTSTYRDLYYALIDSNGSVRTPATIFRTSQVTYGRPSIYTSWEGYGNASQTVLPASTGVDSYVQSSPLVGVAPGGRGAMTINYGSSGAEVINSAVLTVTLDSALTYVDASPPPQIIEGAGIDTATTLTWAIPSLRFLGHGQVLVTTDVPSTTIGSKYPVQVVMTAPGEENVADNSLVVQVMEALQIFLAWIMR